MNAFAQDLRFAFRTLRGSPGFLLVAVLTLALGIGANTTMFSLVSAWVLHPVDFPAADRLVMLLERNTKQVANVAVSAADFRDWRGRMQFFDQLCAWTSWQFDLSGVSEPERIPGARVSADFFRMLGAKPALGRDFLATDDRPEAGGVVLLSYGLWKERFASNPKVLGGTITLNSEPYSVIGVMPEGFHLPLMGRANLWVPLALTGKQWNDRETRWLTVMGRLRSGVSSQQANAALSALMLRLKRAYPETNANTDIQLRTLAEEIGLRTGNQPALIGFSLVGCVLLIACANIANLMLARAISRQKEVAVRLAVGAGRFQVMRQFLVESLMLFLLASGFGILFAFWGVDWMASSIPYESRGYLPHFGALHVDWTTLGYTVSVAIVAGLLFGLAPALAGSKLNLFTALKEGSGRASAGRGGQLLRKFFAVSEIALALIVLVASGLLIKGFAITLGADPGFDARNVLTAQLNIPTTKYRQPAQVRAFYYQLIARLGALPGVEAAALSQAIPFGRNWSGQEFTIDGLPETDGLPARKSGEVPWAWSSAVSPDYLRTLRIPMVKGRFLSSQDGADSPRVAVINETIAQRYWRGQDPIGKRIRMGAKSTENVTIVGVARTVKQFWLGEKPEPLILVPIAQFPNALMNVVLRTKDGRASLAPAIRKAVWAIDKNQPISRVRGLDQLMSDEAKPFLIYSQSLGYFGTLALFLAALGIYGVMAYAVSSRTREIGIRMALGAQQNNVLRLVLLQGIRLLSIGLAVGLAGSLAVNRWLPSMLFGVSQTDPATISGALLVLIVAALLATYIPARRAMKVNPVRVLRYE